MSSSELVRDIREHGLLQPIVLHEGLILDGRNRYRACQHAGIEPRFDEWSGESPTAYVLSFNLHRRHLTEEQRAALVQKARATLDAEAKARMAEAGREAAPGRPARKGVAESPQVSRREPTTRQRLARLADVAEHKMRRIERVHKANPALLDQVHAGEVPLAEASVDVDPRSALDRYPFIRQASNLALPGRRRPRDRGQRSRPRGAGRARDGGCGGEGCGVVTPPIRWTADELARRALLEQGVAVAVNLRRHHNLIAWAKERGLFVRVDRATLWGDPFVIGRDGDRATVIARLPSRAVPAYIGALHPRSRRFRHPFRSSRHRPARPSIPA